MVLYDPHRKWAPKAICRWEDRELFFADAGQPNRKPSPAVQTQWNEAKGICAMCPALRECRRDTLGEAYGVFGGLDQYERHKIRMALYKAIKGWPRERQLAWGKELHALREADVGWKVIQAQTGIAQTPAEWLIRFWLTNKPKPQAKGQVIDLELPPPPVEQVNQKPFPEKPGRRHAWVRSNGLVSDAWYRGQTPEGDWINVTVEVGRGQAHKWIAADDVHLYLPQPVVILNRYGKAA